MKYKDYNMDHQSQRKNEKLHDFSTQKDPKKMEKIDLNSIFSYFSPSFFSLFLFFFSSLLLSLLSRLTLFTLQIGSFHTFFLAFVYSKMTNPFSSLSWWLLQPREGSQRGCQQGVQAAGLQVGRVFRGLFMHETRRGKKGK